MHKGVEIIEGHLMPDHVHILVSIPPRMSIASFMGYLKGKSALMMFDKHANLKYCISAWSIEKDEEDDSLTDYLAFTISRRDATVDVVYVKGILNGLLFDDPHPKLLNTNQEGFHTNTPVTCALNGSDKFCKIYGANVKAFEEANKPKEEEKKD